MKTQSHPMYRSKIQLSLAVISAVCLVVQSASAGLLFSDGFSYTPGTSLSGNGSWTTGGGALSIASGNMTYDSLTDLGGNDLSVTSGVASSTMTLFNSASITAGTVYYSFLLSPTTLPTANQYLTSLNPSNTPPGGSGDALAVYVGGGAIGGTYKIGVRHQGYASGASFTNTAAMTLGSTNLVVVGYTFNPSATDDIISLWFNPTPGGSQPAANVIIDSGGTNGTDSAGLQTVGFKAQSATTAGNWIFDNVFIGDTWASVTPTTVPEPSTLALAAAGLGLMFAMIRRRRS